VTTPESETPTVTTRLPEQTRRAASPRTNPPRRLTGPRTNPGQGPCGTVRKRSAAPDMATSPNEHARVRFACGDPHPPRATVPERTQAPVARRLPERTQLGPARASPNEPDTSSEAFGSRTCGRRVRFFVSLRCRPGASPPNEPNTSGAVALPERTHLGPGAGPRTNPVRPLRTYVRDRAGAGFVFPGTVPAVPSSRCTRTNPVVFVPSPTPGPRGRPRTNPIPAWSSRVPDRPVPGFVFPRRTCPGRRTNPGMR
jgi:hypothetical protein